MILFHHPLFVIVVIHARIFGVFSHQDSGKILNNFRIEQNLFTSYPGDTGIDSLEYQGF